MIDLEISEYVNMKEFYFSGVSAKHTSPNMKHVASNETFGPDWWKSETYGQPSSDWSKEVTTIT